ncbi:DUF1015 domain-containing protein [Ferruginibacter yonginensis]|uniref:DUF1015 domain-containing protein n=1 Tax=Ferruginibacter yonginensis TaxID=1310416 RepID=A0ABV8QR47_9BACT
MITIAPFAALRPEVTEAKAVASPPYDVLNSKEAKLATQGNPNSFLHITKSEVDLPDNIDIHSQEVYDKAKENLTAFISRNILFQESKPCYYIYQLIMPGHLLGDKDAAPINQIGLVCGSSVADYENGLIKKHEFTRPEKELDRITHIKTTGAQTGNVFLAYRNVPAIDTFIASMMSDKAPQYSFEADDAIQHNIWVINDTDSIETITQLFKTHVPASYIADGHHRAASAAKVKAALGNHATPAADIFLTTLFPANQLRIIDYNRVIKDFNGHTPADIIAALEKNFTVTPSKEAVKPSAPHEFGFYMNQQWYLVKALENIIKDDVLGVLDVNVLQENVLTPIFNIIDQRTDKRIDFVGGIRGLSELEKRVNSGEMAVAISLYPVSIEQLFEVADAGEVMPPKSTWFEPKLRDGLLTHLIN